MEKRITNSGNDDLLRRHYGSDKPVEIAFRPRGAPFEPGFQQFTRQTEADVSANPSIGAMRCWKNGLNGGRRKALYQQLWTLNGIANTTIVSLGFAVRKTREFKRQSSFWVLHRWTRTSQTATGSGCTLCTLPTCLLHTLPVERNLSINRSIVPHRRVLVLTARPGK